MAQADDLALSLKALRVGLGLGHEILEDVELELRPGEVLGLVGESGSGKTTTALSLFGKATPGARIVAMELSIAGQRLHSPIEQRRARGRLVSYVPQNPAGALNPSMRVADAIGDMIRTPPTGRSSTEAALPWLGMVGLPATLEFARRFPHQLSGGQQQRVCIAIALACEPAVVVLDEPTTGLDVVTQARIIQELASLRDRRGVAMLFVTHDLAVVSQIADRIAVMYAGRVVEQGPSHAVLRHPRHPYTLGLLASIPDHVEPHHLRAMPGIAIAVGERLPGCQFAPRCPQRVSRCAAEPPALVPVTPAHDVRCFEWRQTPALQAESVSRAVAAPTATGSLPVLEVSGLRAEHRSRRGTVVAAADVSFTIERGSCAALVGESGSGKSTIARTIAGLHRLTAGQIALDGQALPNLARDRTVEQRRRLQIIFQDPADALNPRHTVRQSIARPARILRGLGRGAVDAEVVRLLDAVRLPARMAGRYPSELSGGERQRVAIARALAADPELLICDEITSALDVSVQAAVLALLDELRGSFGLTVLLITHDLAVVATVADNVLVLEHGLICEYGPPGTLLRSPRDPYTQGLLDAAPSLSNRRALGRHEESLTANSSDQES
jgi:peptide/nickel transport system ATP-binding protein